MNRFCVRSFVIGMSQLTCDCQQQQISEKNVSSHYPIKALQNINLGIYPPHLLRRKRTIQGLGHSTGTIKSR